MFIGLYSVLRAMSSRLQSEKGQTMAEYAILIGVIAVAVVAAAVIFGGQLTSLFSNTGSHL